MNALSWVRVDVRIFVLIHQGHAQVRDVGPGYYERAALEDLLGPEKVQSLIDRSMVEVIPDS